MEYQESKSLVRVVEIGVVKLRNYNSMVNSAGTIGDEKLWEMLITHHTPWCIIDTLSLSSYIKGGREGRANNTLECVLCY